MAAGVLMSKNWLYSINIGEPSVLERKLKRQSPGLTVVGRKIKPGTWYLANVYSKEGQSATEWFL